MTDAAEVLAQAVLEGDTVKVDRLVVLAQALRTHELAKADAESKIVAVRRALALLRGSGRHDNKEKAA